MELQTRPRFMRIEQVFSYDREKHFGVVLATPFGFSRQNAIRVEGLFDERPLVGCALKVRGDISLEEQLHDDGSPQCTNEGSPRSYPVIREAAIASLGKMQRIFGRVIRVFSAKEKEECRPPMSIVLLQPIGSSYPRKVYANAFLREGDFLDARGVTETVPAYRYRDGRPVEEIMTRDGRQVYNIEFHAESQNVRHTQKIYQGRVAGIIQEKDNRGFCMIKMWVDSFNTTRPVTCYLSLKEEDSVHEGDSVRILGYCFEKPSFDKEGRPLCREDGTQWTNLVLQASEVTIEAKEEAKERKRADIHPHTSFQKTPGGEEKEKAAPCYEQDKEERQEEDCALDEESSPSPF